MSRSSFRRKRGRPGKHYEERDNGTPELQKKRAAGITSEAIDHCLESGAISVRQFRAALHFRWLYTLRFGCPGVRALNLLESDRIAYAAEKNGEWKAEREMEYREAVESLHYPAVLSVLLKVAIFNVLPEKTQMESLQDGLDRLVRLWKYR